MPATIEQQTRFSLARRVLYACRLLERAGCRILAARAHPRGHIRVDRRPRLDWMDAGYKITAPQYGVGVGVIGDIQVEWTDQRRAAA